MAAHITIETPAVVAHTPYPLAFPAVEGGSIEASALRLSTAPDALTPLGVLVGGLVEHELTSLAGVRCEERTAARQTVSLAVVVPDPDWHLVVVRASARVAGPGLLGTDDAQTLGPLWTAGALAQLAAARCAPDGAWAMCSLRAPSLRVVGVRPSAEVLLSVGDGDGRRSMAGLVSARGRLAVAAAPTPDAHRLELAEAWALVESVSW